MDSRTSPRPVPLSLRSVALAAACAFLASSLGGCAYRTASGADARRMIAARTPAPEEWGRDPLVVLADTVRMRLEPAGKKNRLRLVQTTWYSLGRSAHVPVVWDHESVERPAKVHVQAWSPEGKALPYGRCHRFRPAPGDPSFLDLGSWATTIVPPPAARQGGLVRVVVERDIFRPEHWSRIAIRRDEPVQGRLVSLSYPAGWRVRAGLRDPEGLGARESRSLSGMDSVVEIAVPPMAQAPSRRPATPQDWEAAFVLSMPGTGPEAAAWSGLGSAYGARWRAAIAAKNARSAFRVPDEWTRALDAAGRDREIDVAFELVRDRIRYLADEKGENGLMPRKPALILEQGYGDCKEMATLLWSVLRERGFAPEVALTTSRGYWGALEAWPSLGSFNHMILALPDSSGGVRWFDPTFKGGSPLRSAGHLAGLPALRIGDSGGILDTIPDSLGLVRVRGRHRLERRDGLVWQVGAIAIQGHLASEVAAGMEQTPPGLALPRLRGLLIDHLGLPAVGAQVIGHGPDSVEIAYEMPAEPHVDDKGGALVALPLPWFDDPAVLPRSDGAPVWLAPLDQEDEWVLGSFAAPQVRDSAWSTGSVRWSATGGRLTRRVRIDPARTTRAEWERQQIATRRKSSATGKGAKP